ncbi:CHASE2 domain-containing protein, partial [Imhoffiella purpurea]|uniref:CHASE2 domain-containing protein n=1 Tax=Imhoffiella purpurea TaxID=1249627 RepID=UPI0012FDBD94
MRVSGTTRRIPGSKRLSRTLLLGLALGPLGALLGLSPAGLALEESPVLGWLFRLRGPLPPPDEVALVVVDRASQHAFGLSGRYPEWPRTLHARLVERLHAAGARVIVFDILFAGSRAADPDLARAFRDAGRVVLAQGIERHDLPLGGRDAPVLKQEVLRDPAPTLADAAAALAPFVLPAGSERVTQVWLFRPESGDAPTLPAAAFQLGALDLYPALRGLLTGFDPARFADLPADSASLLEPPGLVETMRRLRGALASNPPLHRAALAAASARDGLSAADRARLAALVDLYGADYSRHLKFYGPPQTIEPLSFARVLTMDAAELERFRGRTVFVGVSTVRGSEQLDTLATTYPGAGSDIRMSGVEIAATAYANLMRHESVRPLAPAALLALLLGWGLLTGGLAGLLPARRAVPVLLLLAGLYSLLVYGLFARADLWLPWLVPIGAQALPALILGLALGWREEARGRRRITAALARYLPLHVAEGLAVGIHRAEAGGQVLKGVCIATDGERYTSLAERLAPGDLHALLNAHYGVVFEPIRRSG